MAFKALMKGIKSVSCNDKSKRKKTPNPSGLSRLSEEESRTPRLRVLTQNDQELSSEVIKPKNGIRKAVRKILPNCLRKNGKKIQVTTGSTRSHLPRDFPDMLVPGRNEYQVAVPTFNPPRRVQNSRSLQEQYLRLTQPVLSNESASVQVSTSISDDGGTTVIKIKPYYVKRESAWWFATSRMLRNPTDMIVSALNGNQDLVTHRIVNLALRKVANALVVDLMHFFTYVGQCALQDSGQTGMTNTTNEVVRVHQRKVGDKSLSLSHKHQKQQTLCIVRNCLPHTVATVRTPNSDDPSILSDHLGLYTGIEHGRASHCNEFDTVTDAINSYELILTSRERENEWKLEDMKEAHALEVQRLQNRDAQARKLAGDNGRRAKQHKAKSADLMADLKGEKEKNMRLEEERTIKETKITELEEKCRIERLNTAVIEVERNRFRHERCEAMQIAEEQQRLVIQSEAENARLEKHGEELLIENNRLKAESAEARTSIQTLMQLTEELSSDKKGLEIHLKAINIDRATKFLELPSKSEDYMYLRPDQLADAQQALVTCQANFQKETDRCTLLIHQLETKTVELNSTSARVADLQNEVQALRSCSALSTKLSYENKKMLEILVTKDVEEENTELAEAAQNALKAEMTMSKALAKAEMKSVTLEAEVAILLRKQAKQERDHHLELSKTVRQNIELDSQNFCLSTRVDGLIKELQESEQQIATAKSKADEWRKQLEERTFGTDIKFVWDMKVKELEEAQRINVVNFQHINNSYETIAKMELDARYWGADWHRLNDSHTELKQESRKLKQEVERQQAVINAFHQRFGDELNDEPLYVDYEIPEEEEEVKVDEDNEPVIKYNVHDGWLDEPEYQKLIAAVKDEEAKRRAHELAEMVGEEIVDDLIPAAFDNGKHHSDPEYAIMATPARSTSNCMVPETPMSLDITDAFAWEDQSTAEDGEHPNNNAEDGWTDLSYEIF